jgi:ABC-type molybdate transport system substrate-binding protein
MKTLRNILTATLILVSGVSLFAQVAPPWSKGANNPASDKGTVFQVSDVDNNPDLHGDPTDAKLVVLIGGNQFFVLPKLIAGFEAQHPELRGHIFYETLPPGILRKQIASNGTLTLGNFTLQVQPDVYEAGARVLKEMAQQQQVETPVQYATNDLAIMVRAGNPKGIHSLNDLGRDGVKLSMPNPAWEDVAHQIGDSLRKAGGEQLYHQVYQAKVSSGDTYLTHIHHRQTPMRIMDGKADAGVTWASEVKFQEQIGNPITGVTIPASQNTTATYAAAALRNAPHPEAARAWVAYLTSPEAQAAYHSFGFRSIPEGGK